MDDPFTPFPQQFSSLLGFHLESAANLLFANPRVRRPAVERFATRAFHPTLLPYPPAGTLPTDIEANRIVIEALLGRPVSSAEALPSLTAPRPLSPKGNWLLAPFSSSKTKDYPAALWAEVLRSTAPLRGAAPLHLAAAPNQSDRLRDFADTLRATGIDNLSILAPQPLEDYIQTIAESALVLTVDTAAAHMACALGSPAVIASAGHHPGVYAPYSPNGLQHWIMPPPRLKKGEWREATTPEILVQAVRQILPR